MFTGIIKSKTKVEIIKKSETDLVFALDISSLGSKVKIGDSIAVDGVCLTVAKLDGSKAHFHLMNETLIRTTFKNTKESQYVNLEDSLTLADKIDGHIVYGEVDCEGTIVNKVPVGESIVYTFSYPEKYSKYVVEKGRITIDGASLSITDSENTKNEFSVSLIPHSLSILNIKDKDKGDNVNLEFDIFAKLMYKQRILNEN